MPPLRTVLVALGLLQAGSGVAPPALVWSKPDQFWFRRDVAGGVMWITVDAAHGVKEPLFDHQRLAIELSLRTGLEFTPLTLPFGDPATEFVVKYDGANAYIQEGAMAVEFLLAGTLWRCELQVKWDWNKVPPTDYECLPRGPMTPGARPRAVSGAPARSPDGRWEAVVEQHNVAIRPAAGGPARRLSTDGTADFPYEAGSIAWSADARRLSAWRVHADVWRSASVTGSVRSLVAKGDWPVPAATTPAADR